MANQDHTPPVIVVLHVVVPGIGDVVVGKGAIDVHLLAGEHGPQGRERDLPVHGSEKVALGAKASKLRAYYPLFFWSGNHIAVGRGIVGDRVIDSDAVSRR